MQYIRFICSCSVLLLLNACGGDRTGSPHASSSVSSLSTSSSSPSQQSSSSSQPITLPSNLSDKLFNRKIEHITSTLPTGTHRESGDLKVYYGSNTILGDNLLLAVDTVAGTYTAVYAVAQQKIQVTTHLLGNSAVDIIDTYTFISATDGLWTQDYDNGSVVMEGSFAIEEKIYPGFAPLSLVGRKASLTFTKTTTNLPPGTYIDSGTAFHIYSTATGFVTDLSNYGLPSGAGTYTYDRPALNIGRDTGFNITFNAPYQIEYQFTDLTSGTFKENWNNGEILWEGAFVLNDIE